MHKAVWVTYFHRISTDENLSHELCPPAPDTWCKYGKDPAGYRHKKSLPEVIMNQVLEELGVKDLGQYTIAALKKFDDTRIKQTDGAAEYMNKEARIKKRRLNLDQEVKNEDEYGPGGF
ncbi:hypothetical protein J6590_086374 [Homalodisca vitripennis]|nr:hypothetical protein J6590_086374 [Homalodisca vitripennis]